MSDNESSSSAASSDSDDGFLVAKSKNQHRHPNDEETDEADVTLEINPKYAREYDARKRREELSHFRHLEALEGISHDGEDESDESESEDEDGELLTADMDVKIIKTLRALKRKEDGIYDRNVTFFSDTNEQMDDAGAEAMRKDDKVKPKRYKDVVREHILEEMENEDGATDHAGNGVSRNNDHDLSAHDLAYDQEQKEIRRAFLESTRDSDTEKSQESDEENWLKPKPSRKAGADESQDELKRLWEQEFTTSKESKLLDPKGEVQDGDKFLMDFMTNRKWVDTSDSAMRKIRDDDEDDSIESFQDRMDDFESKYNFRFEEAAANINEESGATHSIVHYARGSVGDNVLRRKDETRRQKRLARKERKAEERRAKEEQLRRLKNAKREELEERLRQVKSVLGYDELNGDSDAAGNGALGPAEEEMILKLMEGDYDPEKFEQVMSAAYGDDFYQKEDEKWKTDQDVKGDLAKGVEDSDVLGDGDMYDDADEEIVDEENGQVYPEDGGEVDGAYEEEEEQWETEQYPAEESRMEKRLKSKMMDELYKLDYEDIIGDMPTRFKYRSVEPNSYGLTTEEILMAKDTTLKQFVSLKKMAPYRDEGEYQPGTKKRKRFRQMLKADKEEMMQSLDESNAGANEPEEGDATKKKRRRQKKGSKKNSGSENPDDKKDKSNDDTPNLPKEDADAGENEMKPKSKKSKATVLDSSTEKAESAINDGVSKSNEIKPKKEKERVKKDKGKYSNKGGEGRKKKRKHSIGVEGVSAARLASYGI